jgi:hypothetical protein
VSGTLAAVAFVVLGACSRGEEPGSRTTVEPTPGPSVAAGPSWAPRPETRAGLRTLAHAGADGFVLSTAHGPVTFLPGVNLGSTTPGHQPGEVAIGAAEYRRWFPAMAGLGIRVIRIYTIHRPDFYRELAAYNAAHPDRPLYLMQGVYLPNESYVDSGNLYDPAVTDTFRAELRDAVGAVHGDLTRSPRPGRADGTWDADVSAWLSGWIIGVEWDPNGTRASDRRNRRAPVPTGRYFTATPDASATERWLAASMEDLATAEAARGVSAPIAFVNWPTTDPLRHPDEPLPQEDLVGVDANHVKATAAWPGGTFASYHAYPYYPDFQRYENGLRTYRRGGQPDPYGGYLRALLRHHAPMPVMVTEFGVPSSLGSAHAGPRGRDQGGHTEREAAAITSDLLRLIEDVGMSGGLVFEWTDEWFKLTWNTVTHQRPADRRQLWHDPLTNEQHFGLVATDATGSQSTQRVSAHVTARVDESYVHLTVTGVTGRLVTIGLDAVPGSTGPAPPGSTDRRADTALALDVQRRTGQVWIRSALDPVRLDYRVPAGARPAPVDGWRPFQLITNRPLILPSTGAALPMEFDNVGELRHGTWDPEDSRYDSLALWRVEADTLHLRVPWAFAAIADPSSHRALVPDAPGQSVLTAGLGLSVAADGATEAVGTLTWPDWNRVSYRERLKTGADQIRAAMLAVS